VKLYAPDKSLLMEVQAIRIHAEGLMIEGKIMGAMPMKALLTPAELLGARRLMSWALVGKVMKVVFGRAGAGARR